MHVWIRKKCKGLLWMLNSVFLETMKKNKFGDTEIASSFHFRTLPVLLHLVFSINNKKKIIMLIFQKLNFIHI